MKLIIADDHNLVRDSLKFFIEKSDPDAVVVGASSLDGALDAARRHPDTDAVLLDLDMPGMNGVAGITRMKAAMARADAKVVLLSGAVDPGEAEEAMRLGAAGVIAKNLSGAALLHAVRRILRGDVFVSASLPQPGPVAAPTPAAPVEHLRATLHTLSEREHQTLQGVVRGLSNKEIAQLLGVAEVTIKVRLQSVFRKIGARNRVEAARLALEAGISPRPAEKPHPRRTS